MNFRPPKNLLITAAVAAIVGAGLAAAVTIPRIAGANEALVAEQSARQKAERQRDTTQAGLDSAKAERERALAQIEDRERNVADREAKIQQREQTVAATEQKIKENSFAGGVFVVGKDVRAGTYRTGDLRDSCYYSWKTGTEANADIIDNNIVSEGTATVTITDGQVFESRRCGTWTRTQ